jgi:hypothetical protein
VLALGRHERHLAAFAEFGLEGRLTVLDGERLQEGPWRSLEGSGVNLVLSDAASKETVFAELDHLRRHSVLSERQCVVCWTQLEGPAGWGILRSIAADAGAGFGDRVISTRLYLAVDSAGEGRRTLGLAACNGRSRNAPR